MKVIGMKRILDDDRGVEGLPVRLIVVLVVGVIALAAMVAAMNGFKPQKTLTRHHHGGEQQAGQPAACTISR